MQFPSLLKGPSANPSRYSETSLTAPRRRRVPDGAAGAGGPLEGSLHKLPTHNESQGRCNVAVSGVSREDPPTEIR